ncbi:S8 family serine peptidase [Streptomyces sp. DSM 44915]|uniref:S8 family serine peptidase n=1 Tax=Streptomyces chisholmiae TaxID=3075540 RepID=A0ABU2JZG3_9ACTN|nr:S8 family serine peptidase [Streptomyces sp. DSM 44915]MDT0270385.1 S8 family serine peptidase [Streptomyces sp. DSM 44915]
MRFESDRDRQLVSRRRRRRRGTTAVAATAVALAMTAGLAASAGADEATGGATGETLPTVAEARAGGERLTLITGDQVVLDATGRVTGMLPAEGREDIPVRTFDLDGRVQVLPADVLPLIQDGTLDRRLFDVTALAEQRQHAADGLRLIVSYTEAAAAGGAAALFTEADPEVGATLEAVGGEALTVAAEDAAALWAELTRPADGVGTLDAAPGIASVALDGVVTKSLDVSVPQIGAPDAWESGFDGTGVTVAVLDTGIAKEHPDLGAERVVAEQNFSESDSATDRDGHGTHVAATVAGTGGAYTGVAPGAALINGKVLDDSGSGFEADIIEGMQWAVDEGADIVSMSLGGGAGSEIDPMEEAVNTLSAESDALFVIAAGNSGPAAGTIGSPGTADAALTVGAVDDADALADFSSVGPRTRDGGLKPDVTAPGVDIAAAGAEGAAIWDYGTPVDDTHVAISGTSMATPHVSGAAALLAQANPELSGEQLKAVLAGSAVTGAGYSAFQQGSGRIDVPAALAQRVIAEPSNLSFGAVPFPHEDAEPVTRELTYRNLGEEDVTLQLTAEGLDPEGGPAPDGLFTLGADEVTVPAGGTATVEATASTAAGELFGGHSLYVTATAEDGSTVTTAGGVEREEERFTLTVEATDRAGAPAAEVPALAVNLETWDLYDVYGTDGTATARLPEGEYVVDISLYHQPAGAEYPTGVDWLVEPVVELTEDTTLTAAAEDARPVEWTVDDEAAELLDLTAGFEVLDPATGESLISTGWAAFGLPDGFHTAQLDEEEPGRVVGHANATWENPETLAQYRAAYHDPDGFYTGLTEHLDLADTARVNAAIGASVPDTTGVLFVYPESFGFASGISQPLPYGVELHLQEGTAWGAEYFQDVGEIWGAMVGIAPPTEYPAGSTHDLTFNVGVFGPTTAEGLYREGDLIYGWINPYTDGAGHLSWGVHESGSTTLYRDGEEFATANDPLDGVEFEVPADEAEYELVTTVSRGAPLTSVSTEITASYTFTSAASDEELVELPYSAVRYSPELALDSTAPAGEALTVPVTVEGAAADHPDALTVSFSTDGGETWEPVEVVDGAVEIVGPAAGGSVSLRAETTDDAGNALVQTIIDAYRTA